MRLRCTHWSDDHRGNPAIANLRTGTLSSGKNSSAGTARKSTLAGLRDTELPGDERILHDFAISENTTTLGNAQFPRSFDEESEFRQREDGGEHLLL